MWTEEKQRGRGHSFRELPSNYEAASFLWVSEWLLPDCSSHSLNLLCSKGSCMCLLFLWVWRFSCHLECGVNRNAMATCQYGRVYPDGKNVCWLHRFPLKEKLSTHKTLAVQTEGHQEATCIPPHMRSKANFSLGVSPWGGCWWEKLQWVWPYKGLFKWNTLESLWARHRYSYELMAGMVAILLPGLSQAFTWTYYHQCEIHCLEDRLQILTKSPNLWICIIVKKAPCLPFISEETEV